MEQTIDKASNVFVSGTNQVTWDITWTHAGTSSWILESIAIRFTTGNVNGYNLLVTENLGSGNWSYRLNTSGAPASGTTITLPLSSGAWEGKTSGILRTIFKARGSQSSYNQISFVLTYRAVASPSTITVVRTMAGEPQTVMITNTDPDVYHKVTWSYSSYQTHDVGSGELTFAAATRSPAWAVPQPDLEWLYRANPSSATDTGTVTVKTYTADGTLVGTATADAVLDLPETSDVIPAFDTRTITETLDTVAQAIYADTGNKYVQGHTTVSLTYKGEPQLGASIASVKIITPDGVQTVQNNTAASFLLRTSGSYTVRVILTDSRGFTNEQESELFTVTAYTDPAITSIQVLRTDSQGTEQSDGTYAWVEAVAAVTGQTATLTAVIRETGGSQIGSQVTLQNGTAILGGGSLSEDRSYTITVTVEDAWGVTGTATIELGTGTITISRMAGGKGVAFGKIAEKYGVEINPDWPVYLHGQEILRLMVEVAHPVGSSIESIDTDWDPNEEWPWTRWGEVSGKWVRGV